ncbi:50S ribosomal protein L13 [Candidatus Saganbacteria bacterium]|uniref:Large ribosomal subunit protein uL13 n=1 Tax=Candidatus Saganbacteria bacterium TaxID=2575572 RepID=A0A9D6UNE0_UNCSA|nr:50S ribosomal protein L13 [Candidatus Saganbacteria bacterium]
MKKRKTIFANHRNVKREKYLVDATGCVLGKLAVRVANYLRGKQKPIFTPQTDCGDYIVVVNAEKVKVTGNKIKDKMYFTHSGYPGGDKMLSFEKMIAMQPEKVIRLAVSGMIPHNRLGAKMIRKLKVFRGERHEYDKWSKLEIR